MDKPLVSVVVVTHNNQELVTISLESILRQTYHNIEVLVCDQSSTDQTLSILKAFEDDRVRTIIDEPSNYFTSLNRAVALAHGEYILEFSATGIMRPNLVETLLLELEKDTRAVCAIPQFVRVNKDGVIVARPSLPASGDEMTIGLLLSADIVNAPTMFRRLSAASTLYNTSFKQPKGNLLWSTNKSGRLLVCPEYLAATRQEDYKTGTLWGKRYGSIGALWRFPNTVRQFEKEARSTYGEAVVALYKLALQKKDFIYALLVAFCAMRLPGYRHEFLHTRKVAKKT